MGLISAEPVAIAHYRSVNTCAGRKTSQGVTAGIGDVIASITIRSTPANTAGGIIGAAIFTTLQRHTISSNFNPDSIHPRSTVTCNKSAMRAVSRTGISQRNIEVAGIFQQKTGYDRAKTDTACPQPRKGTAVSIVTAIGPVINSRPISLHATKIAAFVDIAAAKINGSNLISQRSGGRNSQIYFSHARS